MVFCSVAIQTKLNVVTVLWIDLKQYEKLLILFLPLPQMCYCPRGRQPLTYRISTLPAVFSAQLASFAPEQIKNTHTQHSSGEEKGLTFNSSLQHTSSHS